MTPSERSPTTVRARREPPPFRRHLFEDRGLLRLHAWVRGYWKHGRSGDANADDA